MFVDDIKDYLEPETQKWYSDRGIPYRRGYLLHGPPGTGKSSLSFAVSGLLGLKLYVLSLASKTLSDAGLASLFEALPPRCVVLLEDIDTIDIAQTRQPIEKTDKPTADATPAKPIAEPNCKVSLSGLLNVIDGVASPEGRVLVLTTNHPEKLDPALIRPGRVDMKIQLRLAGKEAIAELFRSMYEGYGCRVLDETNTTGADPLTSELGDGKEAGAGEPLVKAAENIAKARAEREELLKGLVVKFAELVPERTFSPADIQGYLLQHKNKPERAVYAAEQWVSDRLEARKAGKVD
jgi:chaperone BCS1